MQHLTCCSRVALSPPSVINSTLTDGDVLYHAVDDKRVLRFFKPFLISRKARIDQSGEHLVAITRKLKYDES